MPRVVPQRPLSPQNSGSSIPSTFSAATAGTGFSSLTSPTSVVSGDGRRGGKHTMASESRPSRMRSASSGRRKHARASSNASNTSAPLAFPSYDGADDMMIASLPMAHTDLNKTRSPPISTSKVKIKPFLRKMSSTEKGSLDLSRSQAENEGLGIYTSSNNMRREREASSAGLSGYHTRTSSAVSQGSSHTASSHHLAGGYYVHPMRQTPHTYTPPLAVSYQNSRANSDDGDDSYHTPSQGNSYVTTNTHSYAPLPPSKRPQPNLYIRTQSPNSRLHSGSQTNVNQPTTPSSLRYQDTVSPEAMHHFPSRSSMESAFKRSRTNTVGTTPEEQVAVLRAQFEAKEARKDQRDAEKAARKQKRVEENENKRTRSRAASEKSIPLSAVEYSSTTAFPVDEELEYIRKGKMPPPSVRKYNGEKPMRSAPVKGAGSQWSLFWFKFKTIWLKFKRSIGIKGRD